MRGSSLPTIVVCLAFLGCSPKTMSAEDYSKLVDESNDYLGAVLDAAKIDFKLGSYERYDWDQEKGELVFSDQGVPKVAVKIQFVGSISTKSGTWLWSWDNPSVLENIKKHVQRVRDFGKQHGISKLTTAKWEAEEVDGWEMTAIAAKLLNAKGAYRSPKDDGFTFMVFTDIEWASKSADKLAQHNKPEPTFPDDENGDVLRRMHQSGDDLTKPRDIDFSFVFSDKSKAAAFTVQVKDLDFRARLDWSEEQELWDVTATKEMVPTHGDITEVEAKLSSIAEKYGGQAGGWGCFQVDN